MFIILGTMSFWAGIYTSNLAVAVWRSGNRRGAVGTAVLAVVVLVVPVTLQSFLQQM